MVPRLMRPEMRSYSRALRALRDVILNPPVRLQEENEEEEEEEDVTTGSDEELCDVEDSNMPFTETDVTLPSALVCGSPSIGMEPLRFCRSERAREGESSPTCVEKVYEEMLHIYQKLQVRGAELAERDRELKRREEALLRHECSIGRLCGMEEDVQRIRVLQQHHQQEAQRLKAELQKKIKENRRMRANFNSMKEVNESLRKRLETADEQNRRLQSRMQKLQARFENLQRKEKCSGLRGRDITAPKSHDHKPSNQDKAPPSAPPVTSSSCGASLKLLRSLMDWITCGPPFPLQDPSTEIGSEPAGVPCPSLPQRCAKVLPVLVEQLQQEELLLQLPLLRFICCSLSALEDSSQHLPLTSTLRRLGEEVRRKSLLGSPCPHRRFLSSLLVLRTLNQADILAQALGGIHDAVGDDEGRALFLRYKALDVVLSVLRAGCPGLLAPSLDVLLHMSAESCHLPAFLEECSTDRFFRCAAALLRNPRLDLSITEKLSILLQKLSTIRKNRRLFESSSLHVLLQQMDRPADPARAFLNMNVSSTLLNLNLTPARPTTTI